jgi:hypothetical protein
MEPIAEGDLPLSPAIPRPTQQNRPIEEEGLPLMPQFIGLQQIGEVGLPLLLQFSLFTQIAEAIFRYLPYSGAAAPIAEGYFRYWPLVQARGRKPHSLAENPFRYRRCHAFTAWNNGKTFPLFQPLGHLLPHRGQKRLNNPG